MMHTLAGPTWTTGGIQVLLAVFLLIFAADWPRCH